MNVLRNVVLPLCAAALGFALGTMRLGDTRRESVAPTAGGHREASASAEFAGQSSQDESVVAALTALVERDDFRQLARLGALLDELDAAQMHALLDKLDRLPAADREVFLPRLLAHWTKRDPQAATAWMQPRLAGFAKEKWFPYSEGSFDADLVRAWVRNAPTLAIDYARGCPDSGLAKVIAEGALFVWPDKNPAIRFEVLRDFPPGQARQKAIVSFCFTWAQTDRPAAFAAAAALEPGPARTGALGEILARWAGDEPAVAFEEAKALGVTDPGWLTIMVKEAAKRDPAATARWIAAHEDAFPPQASAVLAQKWAASDPTEALAWALANGVSLVTPPQILALRIPGEMFAGHAAEMDYETPLGAALSSKPDAALAWIRALPTGAERERYLEFAITRAPDLAKVKPFIAELSPEAATRAAGRIASRLAYQQAAQAQQWAESLSGPMREAAWTAIGSTRTEPLPLPPGPDRDAMLSGLAIARAQQAPEQALDRVLEIRDPALRRRTFDDVLWKLNRGPVDLGGGASMRGATETARAAASAWIERANIPEDWKRAWRR
jgi:hypothetical protein